MGKSGKFKLKFYFIRLSQESVKINRKIGIYTLRKNNSKKNWNRTFGIKKKKKRIKYL